MGGGMQPRHSQLAAQLPPLQLLLALVGLRCVRGNTNSYSGPDARESEAAENYAQIISGIVVPVGFLLVVSCCICALLYSRRKRGGGAKPQQFSGASWHPTAYTSAGGGDGAGGYGGGAGSASAAEAGYGGTYGPSAGGNSSAYAATYGASPDVAPQQPWPQAPPHPQA